MDMLLVMSFIIGSLGTVLLTVLVQRWIDRKWYDRNCDCTCGKCACHRPLEECS